MKNSYDTWAAATDDGWWRPGGYAAAHRGVTIKFSAGGALRYSAMNGRAEEWLDDHRGRLPAARCSEILIRNQKNNAGRLGAYCNAVHADAWGRLKARAEAAIDAALPEGGDATDYGIQVHQALCAAARERGLLAGDPANEYLPEFEPTRVYATDLSVRDLVEALRWENWHYRRGYALDPEFSLTVEAVEHGVSVYDDRGNVWLFFSHDGEVHEFLGVPTAERLFPRDPVSELGRATVPVDDRLVRGAPAMSDSGGLLAAVCNSYRRVYQDSVNLLPLPEGDKRRPQRAAR